MADGVAWAGKDSRGGGKLQVEELHLCLSEEAVMLTVKTHQIEPQKDELYCRLTPQEI